MLLCSHAHPERRLREGGSGEGLEWSQGEKGDKKINGALLQVSWGAQQRALHIEDSLQERETILHLIHLSAQVCEIICDQNFNKVALFCWFFHGNNQEVMSVAI